jgi:putative acetyltransferase
MAYIIRDIQSKDNEALAKVIRNILEEMDCALEGTVYTDSTTDNMFENYQDERTKYVVVEINGEIVGGAGIAPIANLDENYCELQKMYLTKSCRGMGIATDLMSKCLEFVKEAKYELVYLETFDTMRAAQKLYKKFGFDYIDHALGNTGHYSCNIRMTMTL